MESGEYVGEMFCNFWFILLISITVLPAFLYEFYGAWMRFIRCEFRILRQVNSTSWNQMRMRSPPQSTTPVATNPTYPTAPPIPEISNQHQWVTTMMLDTVMLDDD